MKMVGIRRGICIVWTALWNLICELFWCANLVLSILQTRKEMQIIVVVGLCIPLRPGDVSLWAGSTTSKSTLFSVKHVSDKGGARWLLSYIYNVHHGEQCYGKSSTLCITLRFELLSVKVISPYSVLEPWTAKKIINNKQKWNRIHYKFWTRHQITIGWFEEILFTDLVHLEFCKIL